MGKKKIEGEIKVRVFMVVDEAIENGVKYGWNRAHKHTDAPSPETVQDEICRAVMNELSTWLDFGE